MQIDDVLRLRNLLRDAFRFGRDSDVHVDLYISAIESAIHFGECAGYERGTKAGYERGRRAKRKAKR